MSYMPLCQVVADMHEESAAPFSLPGLETELTGVDIATVKFDLNLSFVNQPAGLTVSADFNAELFDTATIERLLGHFETLLQNCVDDPHAPVIDAALSNEAERRWLEARNAAPLPASDETLLTLFDQRLRECPDALALLDGDRRLTYAELDRRSNVIANQLSALGVRIESRVGLCMERSADAVIAMLAIVKSGAAYVPLDSHAPAERLQFIARDAALTACVTTRVCAHLLLRMTIPVLNLDRMAEDGPDQRPTARPRPDNLVYVIYTSGSTGTPKGVMVSHRGICNLLSWMRRALNFRPASRVGHMASIAFDASVLEIWAALASGSSLHLPSNDVRTSPERLTQWLDDEEITHCFLVTAMAEATLPYIERAEGLSLEVLYTGGEKLTRSPRKSLSFSFHNLYGPTEASVASSSHPVVPSDKSPPIGAAIDGVRIHLLDAQLRLVPHGLPGEVYIGGDGVARGYIGRPDLTSEHFIPDPFSSTPGARLYRTGDIARWNEAGALEYLGRNDLQVKIRGFRIELGEIEARLLEHPGILEAAVLAREDRPGFKRLVAYWVATDADSGGPSVESIRQMLLQRLPDYMVPSVFERMEQLPLTPNGKVDRKALPAPPDAPTRAANHDGPLGEMEEKLANLWANLLEVEHVGLDDNFFDLGGHSMLALQLRAAMQTQLGVELSVVELFSHASIRALMGHLNREPTAPIEKISVSMRAQRGRAHFEQRSRSRRS
jgi:amino acid adenylation domain-containing protein